MTNKHTTSLIKILRVLSLRPHPIDTSVVLVGVDATRQLLENTHEGRGMVILLLEILAVGYGPLPLPRCLPAGRRARLSDVSLLSGMLLLLTLLGVIYL